MDTVTIEILERMWIQMGRGRFSTPEERQALAKGILYIRTMGEIEAAIHAIEFNEKGDYERVVAGMDGIWYGDPVGDGFASLADVWGRIKEQK